MAVVYVLREQGSNLFKIGRPCEIAQDVEHEGGHRRLVLFREIHTDHAAECEGMFQRLLGSKRVRSEGSTELFEVDGDVMADQVERIGRIFSQLQTARSRVRPLSAAEVSGAERRAEQKDHELRRRLLELKQERSALELQIELLELKLKERIGDAAGITGVASWKMQARRCFDEQIFRQRKPSLYEETLERFHCLDRCAWKRAEPESYRAIQTTCYQLRSGRVFRLVS